MKYLFFILFSFSITFLFADNDKSDVTIKGKSICPYFESIPMDGETSECPYLSKSKESMSECPYISKFKSGECPYSKEKPSTDKSSSESDYKVKLKIKSS